MTLLDVKELRIILQIISTAIYQRVQWDPPAIIHPSQLCMSANRAHIGNLLSGYCKLAGGSFYLVFCLYWPTFAAVPKVVDGGLCCCELSRTGESSAGNGTQEICQGL